MKHLTCVGKMRTFTHIYIRILHVGTSADPAHPHFTPAPRTYPTHYRWGVNMPQPYCRLATWPSKLTTATQNYQTMCCHAWQVWTVL